MADTSATTGSRAPRDSAQVTIWLMHHACAQGCKTTSPHTSKCCDVNMSAASTNPNAGRHVAAAAVATNTVDVGTHTQERAGGEAICAVGPESPLDCCCCCCCGDDAQMRLIDPHNNLLVCLRKVLGCGQQGCATTLETLSHLKQQQQQHHRDNCRWIWSHSGRARATHSPGLSRTYK